ncbi:hypothetical protein [Alicyclobacillus kakegawensis]|uniref:hypothetical protein n=1 Tax=Alicyclobacillus kakegawensis TaxID=392012 RepID=UPI00082DF423|nr:hypothetical protein [Alicyclobacillus kakegawensis]
MISTSASSRARVRRNRLLLLSGGLIVVLFAVAFAVMTRQALRLRAEHSSEFAAYVLSHHLGRAEITTDATGFQTDFCVLQLNQPPKGGNLRQDVVKWMHVYAELDGGTNLTVVYHDPKLARTVTEADAVYRPATHRVYVTIHAGPQAGSYEQRVHWAIPVG